MCIDSRPGGTGEYYTHIENDFPFCCNDAPVMPGNLIWLHFQELLKLK